MEFVYEHNNNIDEMLKYLKSEIGDHGRHEPAHALLRAQYDMVIETQHKMMLCSPVKVILTQDEWENAQQYLQIDESKI